MKKLAFILCFAFNLHCHPAQFSDESLLRPIVTENGEKTISLMKLEPTIIFPNIVADPEQDYSKGISDFNNLKPSVPVLDQGSMGTCVTFATTAAVDATLNLGDAISQQCILELTKSLNKDYWNGAWMSSELIDPLKLYGAVPQGKCGSHAYPNPSVTISVEDYKKLVDPLIQVSKIQYNYKEPMKVDEVKAAIAAGHYVSIGFGLLNDGSSVSIQGFNVIVNGQKKVGGLWACKQPADSKNYCGKMQAGHEVLVTSYDDIQHLFKIQNSWNTSSGNAGFYYMTYEFYDAMKINATEIWAQ